MEKTAFLYPGQGSQTIGMGVSLVDEFPEAAAVFDCASEIAGYNILELCSQGPIEKLSRTLYTQPALYTVEAALTDILRSRGVIPVCAAGHSLGEFSAWYSAESYSFEDGFKLISERGRIMDEADPKRRGTMQAVIGLDRDTVEEIIAGVDGTVVIANINAPGQLIISGDKNAVAEAGEKLKQAGAKRVLPLNVSGAFHSPLMGAAKDKFAYAVEDVMLSDASIPVYTNVTGKPANDVDDIRLLMVAQLTSSVQWVDTIRNIAASGVKKAYEIGPGNVIAGLVRRIDPTIEVIGVSDADSIKEVTR